MKKEIKIVYVPVRLLKVADYNPRKISKEAMGRLKESISRFEMVDPIIVNSAPGRKNIVIGGHMRLQAVKEIGLEKVPVVYIDIPDIEKEKELNLRLNANTGEWDLGKLKTFESDFLSEIGFSDVDLSKIWSEDLKTQDDDFDEAKELAKIKVPQTKLGDLIILGNHKLLCGDSTDPEALKKLFGEEKASMVYSDPVYNISYNYKSGLGKSKNYGGEVNDKRTDAEYRELLKKSMIGALSVAKNDIHCFYYSDQNYIWLIQTLFMELGIENKRVCLWLKNSQNPTPGVAFNKCYEPATYGVKGKPYIAPDIQNLNEVMNGETTTGNDLLGQVTDHVDIWAVKRISGKEMEHATSKPPKLHEKAIRRCTKIGDIILDSFLGSGSTLIAAHQLKRKVYGMELEPVFCDLIIKRFEALTGTKAKVIHNYHEKI